MSCIDAELELALTRNGRPVTENFDNLKRYATESGLSAVARGVLNLTGFALAGVFFTDKDGGRISPSTRSDTAEVNIALKDRTDGDYSLFTVGGSRLVSFNVRCRGHISDLYWSDSFKFADDLSIDSAECKVTKQEDGIVFLSIRLADFNNLNVLRINLRLEKLDDVSCGYSAMTTTESNHD